MTGKKRNALKHGANATEVMLWSERYEDYEQLRAELYLEFSPSGSTEEYLVRTLLDLRWRRRRLDCYDQITMQKELNEIREDKHNQNHGRFQLPSSVAGRSLDPAILRTLCMLAQPDNGCQHFKCLDDLRGRLLDNIPVGVIRHQVRA